MEKIIGIYNANGSLLGEMRYVFDKVFFKKHCALCDITHGMSYKAKSTWLEQVERFPIPIETLHLDEINENVNTPFLTQHHRRIIKPPVCTQQVSYH